MVSGEQFEMSAQGKEVFLGNLSPLLVLPNLHVHETNRTVSYYPNQPHHPNI